MEMNAHDKGFRITRNRVATLALLTFLLAIQLLAVRPAHAAGTVYGGYQPDFQTSLWVDRTSALACQDFIAGFGVIFVSTIDATTPPPVDGMCYFKWTPNDTTLSAATIYNHISTLGCPANSTGSGNPVVCTCNTGYQPDNQALACVLPTAANLPKNLGCPPCEAAAAKAAAEAEANAKRKAQQNANTNPINSGTGNKFQAETDYTGTGVYPLHAERLYNSGAGNPAMVETTVWGSQWRGYYDRSIAYVAYGTITLAVAKHAEGSQYTYAPANSAWGTDPDVSGSLTQQVDLNGVRTSWGFTNASDETETYNASGKLISITNRAGQVQTITWSDGTAGANGGYVLDAAGNPTTTILPAGKLIRVADPANRTLQYGYDASGRAVKMTDPAGGIYHYAYDANGNLASVTYPDARVKTYLYGETANVSATPNAGVTYTHSLTGILDENNTRYASWTYDAAGRAASSEHGAMGSGIDHVGLAYTAPDANGNSTTLVTDVRGVIRTYNFSTLLGVVKTTGITTGTVGQPVQPCDGCAASFAFDANGNVSGSTDFKGNTSCYSYDQARNLETLRLEGVPPGTACPANLATATLTGIERLTTTQWHATFRLQTAVAEPLRITSYTYDVHGNLLTRTVQPTTDATGAQGMGAVAAGTPRTWTYTYNAAGQVLTVDGPRTDVIDITTYTYDAQGNLSTVKNALNQTTTIGGYDANGRAGTITDPNGLITSLTYDARGRLTSRNRGGETTSYAYDNAGNLTNVTLPTGAAYTYTYDAAHRLTQIADVQGNKVAYTLDAAGNRTTEQVRNSANAVVQTHSRIFDTLNHLVQDIGAVNQATVFTYDANGNVLTVTDPLNRLTTNAYDALDRLNQVTNPDTGVIHYAYDNQDQLTQVTDPRNLVTGYTRNGLGNLSQQTSPDTGATSLTYDAAGNVLTRTDAKGQVATYVYDVLNRVTSISYAGTPALNMTYQYDTGVNGIGHLTQVTDSTGTTGYAYNQKGRLTSETGVHYGGTYTTGYAYDAQGRMNSIAYPSGRTINYTFDAQGRIAGIGTTLNAITTPLASNITYEPFGGIHSFAYGDGVTAPVQTYTRNRDQDGRIASYTLNGTRTMSVLYDAASQIVTVNDTANPTTPANYTYDPMSRLTGYTQGAASQGFGYDVDGNRTTQTIGATNTTYAFGTTSNWLSGITVGGGAQQPVSHDAIGATTADTTKQYTYDLRGRLIQTTTALGVVNYEINAQGLRLRKQVPYATTDTEFHYDTQGRLIAEGNTGTTTFSREYVYLGGQPIATLTNNAGATQVYYIQADHLSTPRVITDINGNVVWVWDNTDPFGNNAPNENPSGQGTYKFPLRYTGQYGDVETGLYYNVFRTYDPANGGRYLESDPIGLGGGINTYAYVGGNPLSWVDKNGLKPGDTFPATPAGMDCAAADMFAFIRENSGPKKRFDPHFEVGNFIIKAGDHYTYSDDFKVGENIYGGMWGIQVDLGSPPPGAAAAFHTHTLYPWSWGAAPLDFSRPGQIRGDPLAGDLSEQNRKLFGIQYVGAMLETDVIFGQSFSVPVMHKNMGNSMRSFEVSCECKK